MAHLDPNDMSTRSELSSLRSQILRQLQHTQNMLLFATLAALTIVVVAATIMTAAL